MPLSELEGVVEKIAECGRGKERLRPRPVGNMKSGLGVSAAISRVRMMRAQDMLNHAAMDIVAGFHTVFRVNQEALAADRTADGGR